MNRLQTVAVWIAAVSLAVLAAFVVTIVAALIA